MYVQVHTYTLHKSFGVDIVVLMHKRNESRHTYYDVSTEGAGDSFLKTFKEVNTYWQGYIEAYEGTHVHDVHSEIVM